MFHRAVRIVGAASVTIFIPAPVWLVGSLMAADAQLGQIQTSDCAVVAQDVDEKKMTFDKNVAGVIEYYQTSRGNNKLPVGLISDLSTYSRQLAVSVKPVNLSIADVDLLPSSVVARSSGYSNNQNSVGVETHYACANGGFACSLEYKDVTAQYPREQGGEVTVNTLKPIEKLSNVTLFALDISPVQTKSIERFKSLLKDIGAQNAAATPKSLDDALGTYLRASNAFADCYKAYDLKIVTEMVNTINYKSTEIIESRDMLSNTASVRDTWQIMNDLSRAKESLDNSKATLNQVYGNISVSFDGLPQP